MGPSADQGAAGFVRATARLSRPLSSRVQGYPTQSPLTNFTSSLMWLAFLKYTIRRLRFTTREIFFGAASYSLVILGNPGAISRDDTMFVVKAYYAMAMGAVDLVKISGISGLAVNGTRFVGSSHWKILRKSGKSKKVGPFFRMEFPNGISCPIYTFLGVNCTSSRSTARKSVTAS